MNETGVKPLVASLLDVTGLKKTLTSIGATIVSFGVIDTLQVISISIGIVAGIMAVRHYAVVTRIEKAKYAKEFTPEEKQ